MSAGKYANKLYELVDDGFLSWKDIATEAIQQNSESDNEDLYDTLYGNDDEEDEDEDEEEDDEPNEDYDDYDVEEWPYDTDEDF